MCTFHLVTRARLCGWEGRAIQLNVKKMFHLKIVANSTIIWRTTIVQRAITLQQRATNSHRLHNEHRTRHSIGGTRRSRESRTGDKNRCMFVEAAHPSHWYKERRNWRTALELPVTGFTAARRTRDRRVNAVKKGNCTCGSINTST